jgi:hypothetical protein
MDDKEDLFSILCIKYLSKHLSAKEEVKHIKSFSSYTIKKCAEGAVCVFAEHSAPEVCFNYYSILPDLL